MNYNLLLIFILQQIYIKQDKYLQISNYCLLQLSRYFQKQFCFSMQLFIRKNSNMIFQSLSKKNIITYFPQQWGKKLGQKCEHCEDPIIHEKCISPCKCYYFCHKSCFQSSFQPQITSDNVDIKCGICQQLLNIQLNVELAYAPQWTKGSIISIIGLSLLIIGCICGMMMSITMKSLASLIFFIVYTELVILCCLSYCLIVRIRSTLYKKIITIKQIGSTKLDIQTSAFKDMDVLTAEELTNDYLFTAKK